MKRGWLVALLAACTVRVGLPFHPPADPPGDDRLKDGWTLRLPSGGSLDGECEGGCKDEAASCH